MAPSHAQEAPVPPAATPPVQITPWFALQESFTDNAVRTASERKSDFITRGVLGLEVTIDTGRTMVTAQGDVAYDRYARLASLSGWSAEANAKGVYSVIRDRLALEASGTVTNTYASAADISVVDRSGTANRVQLAAYDVGPRLDARLGDLADLLATARLSQVFYSAADGSQVAALPSDDTMVRITARADTGARSRVSQLLTNLELEGDSRGYRSASAVQSLYVQAAASLRLLARAGYEHISDPDLRPINAEILSAGLEWTPNDRSAITLEGGRRYGRPSWAANARLQLGAKVGLSAAYTEVVQPDQVYIARTLLDQTSTPLQLAPPVVPASYRFVPTLYNQASLNKSTQVRAAFAGKAQSLEITTNWSDREFLATHAHDREWVSNATFGRKLTTALTLTVAATYARTYASPLYGASESYAETIGLAYSLSPRADLSLTYGGATSRARSPGGQTIDEHAVLLAFKKRF